MVGDLVDQCSGAVTCEHERMPTYMPVEPGYYQKPNSFPSAGSMHNSWGAVHHFIEIRFDGMTEGGSW